MTTLSANLNKVALLRNQRDLDLPSVTWAARICIAAGAHGITVHPRPDQRHTRPSDVHELSVLTRELGVELNIEGNPTPELLDLVRSASPAQCTFVPDTPDQRTSDHGWDLSRDGERLRPIIAELRDRGIRVSLFMDPDPALVALVGETGADRIEIYTEPYARAFGTAGQDAALTACRLTAEAAQAQGLGVNAGHDLSLANLGTLCREVPQILEVSIGHALTADALNMGLAAAVRAYLEVLASV